MKRWTRRMIVVAALAAVAMALFVLDACTIVNGLVLLPEAGGAMVADDGGGEAGDGNVDPCLHTLPMPKAPNDPNEIAGTEIFVSVATSVYFGIPDDAGAFPTIGFDLDGVCTCNPSHINSCKVNGPTVMGQPPEICDLGGGVDNVGQKLIEDARENHLDFAKQSNDSVAVGGRSVLIQVQHYNGLPDDSEVQVAVFVSPGLFDGSGNAQTPTFTSADLWSVDMSTAYNKDGTIVPNITAQGYVVNSMLVVDPLDINLPVSQVAVLKMSAAVLSAEIIPVPGGGHTLGKATFTGRWSIIQAIRVIGSFEPIVGGGRICETPAYQGLYDGFKSRICLAADLRENPADDKMNKPCDAVSVAMTVVGMPAGLGALRTVDAGGFCLDASVTCTN